MLYHTDIYVPEYITKKIPLGIIYLNASRHAVQASKADRYGMIRLANCINVNMDNVIEIEVEYGQVTKVVYRIPYNEKLDVCYVIGFPDKVIKTVWYNLTRDRHATLDINKYSTR